MREMRGMFHRTTLVANDRVLTRGAATVHINAGPRYVPNATPQRLMAVAPQAFPQRRILPQRGVNMADRPWIRAASIGGGAVPAAGGAGLRGGAGGGGLGAGRPVEHGPPGRAPSASPAPRIYNPPRAFASTVYGSPHGYGGGAAPVSGAPHSYGAGPRISGSPPASNLPRVYSPPPRPFAQAPVQRPPVQSFHQAYSPAAAPHFAPPPHNFSAPAPSFGGGGFGHAGGGGGVPFGGGGGAHFGGGHRR
jgi:hypothetical protein